MNGNNIINGKVRFAVSEEKARPKWEQAILAKALDGGDYAPNALRFQCKIAKDANNTFELSGVRGGDGIYAMTDGVSDEDFEEALTEVARWSLL